MQSDTAMGFLLRTTGYLIYILKSMNIEYLKLIKIDHDNNCTRQLFRNVV